MTDRAADARALVAAVRERTADVDVSDADALVGRTLAHFNRPEPDRHAIPEEADALLGALVDTVVDTVVGLLGVIEGDHDAHVRTPVEARAPHHRPHGG